MPLIFQYGSNTSVGRLLGADRLNGNGHVVGLASAVGYDIAFTVFSRTNNCAASDIVATPDSTVWGVLYDIEESFLSGARPDGGRTLARIEGPRYVRTAVDVVRHPGGEKCQAETFVVKAAERKDGLATSAEYVSWIVRGLREHHAPEAYLAHVIDVALATNRKSADWSAEEGARIEALGRSSK